MCCRVQPITSSLDTTAKTGQFSSSAGHGNPGAQLPVQLSFKFSRFTR